MLILMKLLFGTFVVVAFVSCSDEVHLDRHFGDKDDKLIDAYWSGCNIIEDHSHDPDHPQENVPHSGHGELEHAQSLKLFTHDEATHKSTRSGSWGDPNTWSIGEVPSPEARVLISSGHIVKITESVQSRIHKIRVDGVLYVEPQTALNIVVETLLITPIGRLFIGTPSNPILYEKPVRFLFADKGPLSMSQDPLQLSRGILAHGNLCIVGQEKTPYVQIQQTIPEGTSQIFVQETPVNWKRNDTLIIPGTRADERLSLVSSSQNILQTSPVRTASILEGPKYPLHIANLTRSIVFESENRDDHSRRAHVMIMHNNRAGIYFASFLHMGRTNKGILINDPELDSNGQWMPGTGSNPRGRYPVHVHGGGTEHGSLPAILQGNVVIDTKGWGFVNHSGNVRIEDNIAVDVFGSAFVTEAGDEIGTFHRNLAIRSLGSDEREIEGVTSVDESDSQRNSRELKQDFGHEGSGFWFQGMGGISVVGNVAAGHPFAYIIYNKGLISGGGTPIAGTDENGELDKCLNCTRIKAENLFNPAWARGKETMSVSAVPVREFDQNVAYYSDYGILARYFTSSIHRDPTLMNNLKRFTGWGLTRKGAHVSYSNNTHFSGFKLRSGKSGGHGFHIPVESGLDLMVFENNSVEGFHTGITFSAERGTQRVSGGYYRNFRNFFIPNLRHSNSSRLIEFSGSLSLELATELASNDPLTCNNEQAKSPYHFYLYPTGQVFDTDIIRIFSGELSENNLYFLSGTGRSKKAGVSGIRLSGTCVNPAVSPSDTDTNFAGFVGPRR